MARPAHDKDQAVYVDDFDQAWPESWGNRLNRLSSVLSHANPVDDLRTNRESYFYAELRTFAGWLPMAQLRGVAGIGTTEGVEKLLRRDKRNRFEVSATGWVRSLEPHGEWDRVVRAHYEAEPRVHQQFWWVVRQQSVQWLYPPVQPRFD